MSKSKIAMILYEMKRKGESVIEVEDELLSADELLTRFYGREVGEDMGQSFIMGELTTA